ncbi:hypothetical protein EB796_024608 [Bugula neritina]|uniref:Scaffold protein Nfu/NifU N-terminal domain-containing protein n=1 Tax=Bugula neritina TaxID=10212 RepID=A0A7J7IU46_BUGNE|nr:hypothetical protein EB796_024608 [Bugula neritina]
MCKVKTVTMSTHTESQFETKSEIQRFRLAPSFGPSLASKSSPNSKPSLRSISKLNHVTRSFSTFPPTVHHSLLLYTKLRSSALTQARRTLFIQTQETPNPNCLKFLPGTPVLAEGTVDFPNIRSTKDAPLAKCVHTFSLSYSSYDFYFFCAQYYYNTFAF